MTDPLPDHARPIAWIDVETTDLDEHAGAVLEVGLVVTDPDLHETAARAWTVRYVGPVADVIARMHGPAGSGLLTPTATGWACAGLSAPEVDAMAAVWLREACRGVAPLWGGRNVSFDRRWCRAHLPHLHDTVHHRSLDETTLRIALAGWAGVTVPKDATAAGNTHRALADLRESLRVARAFRDAVRGGR
jgi:oligoribonuclease